MLLSDISNITMTTAGGLSGSGEEASVYSHPVYLISRNIWRFASPIILLCGNFGNIMTIIIMNRTKTEEAVIDVYFVALACVDLVTLDILFLFDWLGMAFGYFVSSQHSVICKVHNFTVGCLTIGGWILVCLSTHRAISVVWPHRVNALCSRRLVTSLIIGMAVFFTLAYSHYLYGYHLQYSEETGEYSCQMKLGSYTNFVQNYFTYIDLVLYCLLPSTFIILANSVLVWSLRATLQTVHQNYAEKESVAAREKAASSVTRTVILVSVAYIVLTLPVSVFYMSMFIFDPAAEISVYEHAMVYLLRAITFMLMFCNNAINFYLYCLTGKKFRGEFLKIFCRRES